jgi:hypothetical protein
MTKERTQNGVSNVTELSLKEIIEQLPPSPPEHAQIIEEVEHVLQLIEKTKKRQQ